MWRHMCELVNFLLRVRRVAGVRYRDCSFSTTSLWSRSASIAARDFALVSAPSRASQDVPRATPTHPNGDPATPTVIGKTVAMACRLPQQDSHDGRLGSHEFPSYSCAEIKEQSLQAEYKPVSQQFHQTEYVVRYDCNLEINLRSLSCVPTLRVTCRVPWWDNGLPCTSLSVNLRFFCKIGMTNVIVCTTLDKQCACRAPRSVHGCKTPTRRIQFHSIIVDITPLCGLDTITLGLRFLNTSHCTILLLCSPTICAFVSPLRAM